MVERVVNFFSKPHWPSQHNWRRALWHGMSSLGLTGLHALPVHRRWIDVVRLDMPIVGLDREFDGFRLVQISDLHFSPMVLTPYLGQLMEIVNRRRPDVVVVTGDLITGGHRFIDGVVKLLGKLRAPHVVATFGNHDYTMHGKRNFELGGRLADRLEVALERRGIHVLRNECHTIKLGKARLTLVGLDDEWTGRLDPDRAWQGVDASHPVICLNHNPINARELLDYPWQWMLAGHTHGRALNGRRPFVAGHYELAPHRHLYVNRGSSYGDRRRPTNRPEITCFKLRRATAQAS